MVLCVGIECLMVFGPYYALYRMPYYALTDVWAILCLAVKVQRFDGVQALTRGLMVFSH